MQTILITGSEGFVGNWLLPAVHEIFPDATVVRCFLPAERPGGDLPACDENERALFLDLDDPDSPRQAIAEARPDGVIHLAGRADVQNSWKQCVETFQTNVIGTVRLLQALARQGKPCRFVNIGSGDVYGAMRQDDLPTRESHCTRPSSPYAVSKLSAELAALQHGMGDSPIETIALRPFAHTGPGQTPKFVCSAFARQIAQIEAGILPPSVHVGNLEALRDLSDVRDIARAYAIALKIAPPGRIFNVCGGVARKIEDILQTLLSLTDKSIEVVRDEALLRPVDTPEIRGDSSKFRQTVGWTPKIPFEQTLADLLDWWREETARKANA